MADETRSMFTPPARDRAYSRLDWKPTLAVLNLHVESLKPGTYLYETGTHPSIQAPMGLYGVVVVTDIPLRRRFRPL